MNVIVSNKQKEIIDNANIDAIKDLNGLFNVNDLINKFKNYFFSKMIIDATSIVDFASKEVLTTLAETIGSEKLIILLPATPEPPIEFKKLLINLKIYNFTNDINDVLKFIEKSNTYEDVMKTIDNSFDNSVYVDNSIKDGEESGSMNSHVESSSGISNSENNQASLGDILNNLNLNTSEESSNPVASEEINNEIVNNNTSTNVDVNSSITDNIEKNDFSEDNFKENIENEKQIVSNDDSEKNIDSNEIKNTFLITDDFNDSTNSYENEVNPKIVIGLKNVTTHAGCTSLIYMLHRMVEVNLKKDALSIEVGKNDFRLYRNSKMISVDENKVKEFIDNSHVDVIFVDLNDSKQLDICTKVLYLVEPSTIKLNGLMAENRNIFKELKGHDVLLNKSLLSTNDIRTLESEAGITFLYSIAPLNDRIFNESISKLLDILGIK